MNPEVMWGEQREWKGGWSTWKPTSHFWLCHCEAAFT